MAANTKLGAVQGFVPAEKGREVVAPVAPAISAKIVHNLSGRRVQMRMILW